mgnify:CR=1 FL=1
MPVEFIELGLLLTIVILLSFMEDDMSSKK